MRLGGETLADDYIWFQPPVGGVGDAVAEREILLYGEDLAAGAVFHDADGDILCEAHGAQLLVGYGVGVEHEKRVARRLCLVGGCAVVAVIIDARADECRDENRDGDYCDQECRSTDI